MTSSAMDNSRRRVARVVAVVRVTTFETMALLHMRMRSGVTCLKIETRLINKIVMPTTVIKVNRVSVETNSYNLDVDLA